MMERAKNFKNYDIRAILEGRKSMFREPIKPQPPSITFAPGYPYFDEQGKCYVFAAEDKSLSWNGMVITRRKCPFGTVGDILYVRETWAKIYDESTPCLSMTDRCPDCSPDNHPFHYEYRADTNDKYPGEWPEDEGDNPECPKWKPSIHMPKEASRILLEIDEVRVERVQDITEEDARAEGFISCKEFLYTFYKIYPDLVGLNPWVWVVTFHRAGVSI